jgi:hypothetical protein
MFEQNSQRQIRDHYSRRTRSLKQAAHAAHEIATAEHLPIEAARLGDAEQWHRETLLKTVPVYGMRDRQCERVPAGAQLDPEAQSARLASGDPEWSDLKVKGEDFRHYMAWLHSVW